MQQLIMNSKLYQYDSFAGFAKDFEVGEGDLILSNEYIVSKYADLCGKADFIYQERYGNGEPSDEMFDAIYTDMMKRKTYKRIIGIGGGTVLDLSKLLSLKDACPIEEVYRGNVPIQRARELVLIPTTCGTGSEVTNVSILTLVKKNLKMGLAVNELYADQAVLIPELLEALPFRVFATSSVDAFIHAVESSLSPKATPYTELFGYEAMRIILEGYKEIANHGEDARKRLMKRFLIASNYAGLAFGTAGCGPVHALSYPLSGTFHVAHGEANYSIFFGIMKWYQQQGGTESFRKVMVYISHVLGCYEDLAFEVLEKLLDGIIQRKSLKEYGMTPGMWDEWAKNVDEEQQRLMKNSPIKMNREDIASVYQSLYEG
ncbi:MAG: 4-hydroxybutyrate dehydrogenase [Clostridiales bacterium]|nr:4-hydroxybutyrate dehydrogenase [Clostridiales bacterium]